MKSILLTSTALVAFAGAAAAGGHTSISTALSGTLGFNDTVAATDDNEDGFYWEGNLKTTATAELDNGLTAGAYFEITVAGDDGDANDDGGQDLASSDFVLSLTSETASLFFGDTGTAADKHWTGAGNMEQDGFTSGTDSAVLRGDVMFGSVDASVSTIIDDATNETHQLSFGAGASFGMVDVSVAYQEESTAGRDGSDDFNEAEILGVSATGTFAGATVTVAYADNSTAGESSTGVALSYPIGPVTLKASYVDESNGDANIEVGATYADGPITVTAEYEDNAGSEDITLDASYDLGNGLTITAGAVNEDEVDFDFYIAADYDLGGGASVMFSYAMDDNGDQADEIGSGDYQEGATIEVSFAF